MVIMSSSISALLRWLLRHRFQTRSNSLECIAGIAAFRRREMETNAYRGMTAERAA